MRRDSGGAQEKRMEEGAISEKKKKNSDLYLRPKKKIPIPIKKVIYHHMHVCIYIVNSKGINAAIVLCSRTCIAQVHKHKP